MRDFIRRKDDREFSDIMFIDAEYDRSGVFNTDDEEAREKAAGGVKIKPEQVMKAKDFLTVAIIEKIVEEGEEGKTITDTEELKTFVDNMPVDDYNLLSEYAWELKHKKEEEVKKS